METLLEPAALAQALTVPVKTLALWRCEGTGPAFIRVGKHCRYRQSDVDAWLASRTVTSTSSEIEIPATVRRTTVVTVAPKTAHRPV